jgi:hypothetical protein
VFVDASSFPFAGTIACRFETSFAEFAEEAVEAVRKCMFLAGRCYGLVVTVRVSGASSSLGSNAIPRLPLPCHWTSRNNWRPSAAGILVVMT